MGSYWDGKLPSEFTFPATVGLSVVLITIVVLFLIQTISIRGLAGVKGTKYVVDSDGSQVVRRSTRSVRKPHRFEPVLHGQGGEMTPGKEGTPASPIIEKLTPKVRTPKAVSDAIKAVSDSPVVKGRGRPRKASESASPAVSPPRARRGVRSPS